MTTKYAIDRVQGQTSTDDTEFGYVFIGDGGQFFEWRYDDEATESEQIDQVIDTLNDDEIDPPTGYWDSQDVEQSLRDNIETNGLR